jgi:hypothetical protein
VETLFIQPMKKCAIFSKAPAQRSTHTVDSYLRPVHFLIFKRLEDQNLTYTFPPFLHLKMNLNTGPAPFIPPNSRPPPLWMRHLSNTPPEIVHQILTDLPLIKIFQILSHKIPFLENCILSHLQLKKLFTSRTALHSTLNCFTLYLEVCAYITRSPSKVFPSLLARNFSQLAEQDITNPAPWELGTRVWPWWQRNRQIHLDDLRKQMLDVITSTLDLSSLALELLAPHNAAPYSLVLLNLGEDVEYLRTRWNWVREAKRKLNESKARQLNLAADLYCQYPGKLMLKKPLDPSQDGPRPNVRHIENYLRQRAKRVLADRKFNGPFRGKCCPGIDLIELIPYDRYLKSFLDTLSRFPVDHVGVEGRLKGLFIDEGKATKKPAPFQYPENIAADIERVLDGLMYVYTQHPLMVPRVQLPSAESADDEPVFCVQTRPHSLYLAPNLHRCLARKVMLHDEREYEWLKAFLAVVDWMEKNLVEANVAEKAAADPF